MRKGFNNSILYNDTGEFLGLCLGSDFTSEHEWGINNIAQEFRFAYKAKNNNILGADKSTVDKFPENSLHYFTYGQKPVNHYLILDPGMFRQDLVKEGMIKNELWKLDNEEFASAWSWSMFGIRFIGKNNGQYLKELYEAFQNKNVCFLFSGDLKNPFARSGLCIVIRDRLDHEVEEKLIKNDMDRIDLEHEAKLTGIKDYIDKLNSQYTTGFIKKFGYLALSPAWCSERKKEHTDFPVMFWLNPINQREHNAGWFTVEDLMRWTNGLGPVIKEYNK